jgi:mRNA interferase MazF
MRQGELWYVDLNPTKGSEQKGQRSVLIISGNLLNEHLNVVIACPLTTKVKQYKGNLILRPSAKNKLTEISEVLTFHIRSISKERLIRKIGYVEISEVNQVKQCLDAILKY